MNLGLLLNDMNLTVNNCLLIWTALVYFNVIGLFLQAQYIKTARSSEEFVKNRKMFDFSELIFLRYKIIAQGIWRVMHFLCKLNNKNHML